jgi:hypothetical protein
LTIVWSSDEVGNIGNGDQITISDLSVGIYNITVTVRDLDGNSSIAWSLLQITESSSQLDDDDDDYDDDDDPII